MANMANKSVPFFCCETSRDKAFLRLTEKFPEVSMELNTGWAGETGIEIETDGKTLQTIIDFIRSDLSLILSHFGCAN